MKKQLILAIVLVAMIVIAVGTYFIVAGIQNNKTEKELEEAAALQLCTFTSNDVNKIDIHTPEMDYTVAYDSTYETWVVTDGDEINVNTNYIDTLCSEASELTASENLGPQDDATLEKYELDDPIVLTYHTNGDNVTLYIGTMTPTEEYFYVMTADSDDVFLVDANVAGYLYVTKTQMRYRYLINDTSSEYVHFYLERNGTVIYDFVRDDGMATWEMTGPVDFPIGLDYSMIEMLETNVNSIEVDDYGEEYLPEEQYAEYGFDNPGIILEAEQENGDILTLWFADYDPLVTSYVPTLNAQTGEVYYFDSSYITFLQRDTSEFLVKSLCNVGTNSLEAMTISYNGSFNDKTLNFETSFEFVPDESIYICDGYDFSDDSDAVNTFNDFYAQLSTLSYNEIIVDADIPDIEDVEPTLYVDYILTDEEHTLALYPYEDNSYWVFIDEKYSFANVRQ